MKTALTSCKIAGFFHVTDAFCVKPITNNPHDHAIAHNIYPNNEPEIQPESTDKRRKRGYFPNYLRTLFR